MDPQVPPKRMTRARAAAEASVDTTSSAARAAATRAKASTAASKAKSFVRSTATATTASVAAKRKIRSEDVETDNEQDELGPQRVQSHIMKAARGVRGRTKKTATDADAHEAAAKAEAEAEAAAPTTRPHRGRPPKKTVASEPEKQPKPSTARTTRTRKTAKADGDGDDEAVGSAKSTTAAAAAKKTTRTRAKSTTSTGPTISVRTAAATISSKPAAPKKRVTFEEPEKENIAPKMTVKTARSTAASKASETSTGLRAQPARRPATSTAPKSTTAARSARTVSAARGKSAATEGEKKVEKQPIPLSPKKVTQVRMARDDVESEDELGAMDSQPVYVKPLLRSPSRPGLGMGAQERAKTLTGAGLDLESAWRDIGGSLASDGIPAASAELTGTILASPARRPPPSPAKDGLLRSPARRLDGVAPLDTAASTVNPTLSRGPLLLSPAKRFPIPAKSSGGSLEDATRSPSKMSLLQTPAKRPASPIKAAIFLHRPDMKSLAVADIAEKLATTPEPKSTLMAPQDDEDDADGTDDADDADDADDTDDTDDTDDAEDPESLTQMLSEMASNAAAMQSDSPTRLRPPRDTHAAVAGPSSPGLVDSNTAEDEVSMAAEEDPMEVDEPAVGTAPAITTAVPAAGAFGLRARDLASFEAESDSEDEPTPRIPFFSAPPDAAPSTPCPAAKTGKRRMSRTRSPSSRRSRESLDSRSTAKRLRVGKLGFTPLAEQLNSWKAHSPEKMEVTAEVTTEVATEPAEERRNEQNEQNEQNAAELTVPSTVSEEVMADQAVSSTAAEVLPPIFDKVSLTQEDLELAEEANDMSLMETEETDTIHVTPSAADESESEDSQEYGDENAIPIDPALMEQSVVAASAAVPPVTPQRVMMHTFHTVSKVPLKAADESSPQPAMRRRSFSAPRRRPTANTAGESSNGGSSSCGLTRNGTVISYSPTKKDRRRDSRRQSRRDSFAGEAAVAEMLSDEEREIVRSLSNSPAPATPARSDGGWSVAATPARTPRRDIDPALLRGAVVFVDVYTTEGADASGIFVELLTQMGARCVKNWPWDPLSSASDNSSSSAAESTSKIGITHVVFKDGGKRTLEKVRESAGVVQCVGVSWVLDCERENQWLDEAPYYVDTSAMPRGGGRRRKSMEPRALANMNGMMVTTPAKQTNVASKYRDCRTAPSTPANRRQNTAWEDSPATGDNGSREQDDDEECEDGEGEVEGPSEWMLTAVPKTPAPEAIARYAAALSPSTELSDEEEDDDTIMSMHDEQSTLLTRTCPPKNTCYRELGEGILSREKDEGVLMRLMSARRKSLQFAPKIASPLSKAWY